MNVYGKMYEEWKGVLEHKAQLLLSQIAHLQSGLLETGADPDTIASISRPYFEQLENLYSEDYGLVHAMDNSDFVVRLKGKSIDHFNPRISVVTSYFEKVRKQVTKIARAAAELSEEVTKAPKEFDLTVTAFAKGSLILGFSLPTVQDLEEDGRPYMFGEDAPLYRAAREAIRTLGVVSHAVAQDAPLQDVAAVVPDARLRDVTLSALRELAPSGRQGVSSVAIAGKDIGTFKEGTLTKENKAHVRKVLERPVISNEFAEIRGQIREMDLDAKRFDLRHIENERGNTLRCKYAGYSDAQARKWLDKYVTVRGIVERDADGKARLMEVHTITID